jgi:anhydro-N-acetylmuramic acid kinase
MESKQKYKVIGLMSGTSLDGLDIANCTFKKSEQGWHYSIEKAQTVRYPAEWIKKLSSAHLLSGEQLIELDVNYGRYLGKIVREFISVNKFKGRLHCFARSYHLPPACQRIYMADWQWKCFACVDWLTCCL